MKNSVIIIFLLAILAACSNTKKTPSGHEYTLLREGNGVKIDSSKFVVLSLVFKDGKDSVWNDTRKNDFPVVIPMQGEVPPEDAVLEIIKFLAKGDSVTFKVSAKQLFDNTFHQPMPSTVDSTQQFTFNIGIIDVLNKEETSKLQEELMAKQNKKMVEEQKAQLAKDIEIIDNHLKSKNITASSTPSGLRYVITQPGKGENAKVGQSVKIDYTGYLLDGKFFDSSIEKVARQHNAFTKERTYGPYEVVIGQQQVILGWEEAAQLMNKGTKMQVYIPSTLAYGNRRRSDVIPENSILVFDMELVEIK